MRNLLKIMLFTAAFLFLKPSCASYRNVTFEPCLPRDKDEITIKQKITNYIAEPDKTYNFEFRLNQYSKDKQLRLEKKFMEF